ncbi:MAG: hypothetical protein HY275_19720 [Gemmatimonadetes bacterium]|nr:hypothetical protein [Gemmatimonadota bacterium]
MGLVLLGIGLEVGAILSFRTILGIGPRPGKLISFGVAGAGVALAMFFAHINMGIVWTGAALLVAFLAQSYHVWMMCKRHWEEYQRRKRAAEGSETPARRWRA